MWSTVLIVALAVVATEQSDYPSFHTEYSDGVRSLGYEVIYGNEDLTVINEVVRSVEKKPIIKRDDVKNTIHPLPADDVKCLMSVDRYCSKDMMQMKSVLIQAVKEDCKKCTTKQKDDAGKVIASMLAHDPVAWKLFLTRYDGLPKVQKILG
ncbi:uncharacterized protein LOC126374472 [Pectinophora gossypiella]|uniref:uncharacterized protein LOC126374472 n=1 Tax=Pectinophora gossypiella TaxID=13191 RepID=UPI00214E54AA|nr:uncharacterized protein LOC126374472 [Pectinophora gossypiella]XP_049877088.1 uncharacterized protein LOC126374472 [Pectinophora gossypiella]